MNHFMLIIFIGLLGGMAIGLQGPFSSIIGQRLGILESVFIVHAGGANAALIPLIFLGGGSLGSSVAYNISRYRYWTQKSLYCWNVGVGGRLSRCN